MTSTDVGRPGPRHTRQRSEIRQAVEALASFATAQEVHDRLRHEGSGVGLATVYRTLQAMTGGGELDSIRTPDGQIACRTCGRTVEVTVPQLEQLVRGMASDHGFASIDHEVEFFGVCTTCAAL